MVYYLLQMFSPEVKTHGCCPLVVRIRMNSIMSELWPLYSFPDYNNVLFLLIFCSNVCGFDVTG